MLAGNAASLLQPADLPGSGLPRFVFGVALGGALVLGLSRSGQLRAAVGSVGRSALRGALIGVALGAAAGLVGLAVLEHPLIATSPITYAPLVGMTLSALAGQVLVSLPIAVVLPEELAFRGALLVMRSERSRARAVARSATAFALWHAAIVVPTLRATNLSEPFVVALALTGAVIVLIAGGIALAVVRLRTGTLASTIAAHWSFNATLLFGLWALGGSTV